MKCDTILQERADRRGRSSFGSRSLACCAHARWEIPSTALKVLIAGGGIGGLTAACCLRKAGHAVEVFEQAPELAEIGAGIQLSANAMHVLNELGLGAAIAALAVQPAAYVFRLHDSGEEIGRFALADEHRRRNGAPYSQLHRADLHDLLADKFHELDGVVHLASRVDG